MSQCSCDFIRNCSLAKVDATAECIGKLNLIKNINFSLSTDFSISDFRVLASHYQYVHHKEIVANS